MPLFPTAITMVVCLNFLLSWISNHYRVTYPTVANVKEIGQKMALFPTATTMVVCLNFSLSRISDHYRLAYPTVANDTTEQSHLLVHTRAS
nr:hypothetical protein [Streptococcus sobrinus]